jgi:hypothetical protein
VAHLVGYSLIEIATGNEFAWSPSLPWTVDYPSGRVTLDKVGLEVPDKNGPLYKVVERWQSDEAQANYRQTGYGAPTFDGTQVNVPGVYAAIPQAELDEAARKQGIVDDTDGADLLNQLKTATAAQIKTYINNNVTDLATARTMLIRVAIFLARNL